AYHSLSGRAQTAAAVSYHCFLVVFMNFAVAVILRGLFEKRVVQSDHVVGALCGYLLAGAAWGNLYVLTETLLPGSFNVSPAVAWQLTEEHTRRFLFNYYSFVTLTTLGYGDITPVSPAACSLTWIEAVFGQFYVAVVVAQLVGLKLAQAISKNDPGSSEAGVA